MNTYLIQSKIELLKEFKQDFKLIYNVDVFPFTNKLFFYFYVIEGKKYVHRKSLEFIYSNADTYTYDIDPYYCNLKKEYLPFNIISYLSSINSNLLPPLLDINDKFLVYDYINGIPINSINKDEYYYLKNLDTLSNYTAFYNSMCYNLLRDNEGKIVLIDLKHFEIKKSNLPFFLYFYNKSHAINCLYYDNSNMLPDILNHISIDYPTNNIKLINYETRNTTSKFI